MIRTKTLDINGTEYILSDVSERDKKIPYTVEEIHNLEILESAKLLYNASTQSWREQSTEKGPSSDCLSELSRLANEDSIENE